MPTRLEEILTRTTLAKTMLREDTGPKMVVSDFDAFIHGCTIRGTQNFVNKIPCRQANRLDIPRGIFDRAGYETKFKS